MFDHIIQLRCDSFYPLKDRTSCQQIPQWYYLNFNSIGKYRFLLSTLTVSRS